MVINRSTMRKRYPGVMKSRVSPDHARTAPLSSAALSSKRKLVVPIATMRPPLARVLRFTNKKIEQVKAQKGDRKPD